MKGVHVIINKDCEYQTPFGFEYDAKGFYIQKKFIIVVGCLGTNGHTENTIRIKYPLNDVKIKIIE